MFSEDGLEDMKEILVFLEGGRLWRDCWGSADGEGLVRGIGGKVG